MPFDVQQVRDARPRNQIQYLPTVGSTMQVAAGLAGQGAAHGVTVVAEQQTAGQGRLGRSWISEPEVGLYCSVVLRLPLPPAQLPIATLLLGLATVEAIQRTTNLICDLRWPNDVLIRERKAAGILAQLAGDVVIAGIGVNVNQSAMPDGLRTPSTSLRIASGAPQSREALLIGLLESIDELTAILQSQGPSAILSAFTAASSYAVNRRVVLEDAPERVGTTVGLDENGFLLVRFNNGVVERIAAGGVRAAL